MKLCKPLRSPRQAVFIMVFTVLMVVLTAFLVPRFPEVALYLRLLGGTFLFIGSYLLFRYTMTEFVYTLQDGVFTVRRIIGFSERTLVSIELTEAVFLYTKAEFRQVKTSGGKSLRQNLTAATAFIVYEKNGKKRHLEFEPNFEFYCLLKNALEEKKDKK